MIDTDALSEPSPPPAAAGAASPQPSWLAIECGGAGLLVPLAQAGAVFPVGTLTPLAHTQPWFAGIAGLEGEIHGVVDLGAFLGLPPAERQRDTARLLTLNPAVAPQVALLVDRLCGLRAADGLERDGEAEKAPRPPFAGSRWRDAERGWQEIDFAALVRDESFLAIARPA